MKTIIFDLDYTLFDAKKFREECLTSFFDMDDSQFEEVYQNNKKNNKHFNSDVILKEYNLSSTVFDNFLEKEIDKYLYPEAVRILNLYKQRGDYLVLATFGNIDWQKKKIGFLKIGDKTFAEFFDKIIVEDKDKAGSGDLLEFIDREVEIINDNEQESLKLVSLLGNRTELFLIKGPYSKTGYKNLTELASVVFPENVL